MSRLTVRTPRNGWTTRISLRKKVYIQSATLQGRLLNRFWITHHELIAAGTQAITLGPKPNKEWGMVRAEAR